MSLHDLLLDAITGLAKRPGGPVRLADLRRHLPSDWDQDGVTAALLYLDREMAVQLEPDPDRMGLTDADREAAIKLAGRDMHLVLTVTR